MPNAPMEENKRYVKAIGRNGGRYKSASLDYYLDL
jgi:hypothetical protein